jgi:arginyl-tRNA synthetase
MLSLISLDHAAERALAFELLQFGEVIRTALDDLMPCRLCSFLYNLSVIFTDFVTKCHVLHSEECFSRLLLCEATKRVLAKSFELLGIGTLDRI